MCTLRNIRIIAKIGSDGFEMRSANNFSFRMFEHLRF